MWLNSPPPLELQCSALIAEIVASVVWDEIQELPEAVNDLTKSLGDVFNGDYEQAVQAMILVCQSEDFVSSVWCFFCMPLQLEYCNCELATQMFQLVPC